MKLRIASDFTLPLDAVTNTFAILAKRGVGKSYTAAVMAEEMLKAKQQIIIVDPTGAHWGLRSGFPVAILGGEHADVPLEESAGEVVARAIVEHRFPCVLDLSLFRKGQMIRFMIAFLETLYRLNREAVHLFVDEADQFAPQGRSGFGVEESRMLGAMEDIVRRGRKRGIGCTLISQRPAVLNKNVLTQAEVLVAMRLVHPKDIDAIREWVNVHGDPNTAKAMIAELPTLPVGTAWWWSPGWGDFFQRVAIRHRDTFDSGATPLAGEKVKAPRFLAPLDLAALGDQIKTTVEKVKADDPRELRRRIADLERQLAARPAEVKTIEVPIITDDQLAEMGRVVASIREGLAAADQTWRAMESIGDSWQKAIDHMTGRRAANDKPKILPISRKPSRPEPKSSQPPNQLAMPKAERLILTALAQVGPASKAKVAIVTGYAVGGGGFNNAISSLRQKGFIDGSDPVSATVRGIDQLGDYTPLPTGPELLSHWYGQLGKAEREILEVLAAVHPESLSKDAVAERTPSRYAASGGGFNNAVSRLRTLELIVGRSDLRASDELFG
jgi:hypothetical protein